MTIRPGDSALASRLKKEIKGEVLFDAATRGRYSTDASIYQIEPIGVVIPQTEEDAVTAMQIGIDAGVAVLPRGGGTSQCGQTVGEALVIEAAKVQQELEVHIHDAGDVLGPFDVTGHPVEAVGDAGQHLICDLRFAIYAH